MTRQKVGEKIGIKKAQKIKKILEEKYKETLDNVKFSYEEKLEEQKREHEEPLAKHDQGRVCSNRRHARATNIAHCHLWVSNQTKQRFRQPGHSNRQEACSDTSASSG